MIDVFQVQYVHHFQRVHFVHFLNALYNFCFFMSTVVYFMLTFFSAFKETNAYMSEDVIRHSIL